MLTTYQRTILTSRLDDYKADPEQGENWESVITELSGQLIEANPVEFDGISCVVTKNKVLEFDDFKRLLKSTKISWR